MLNSPCRWSPTRTVEKSLVEKNIAEAHITRERGTRKRLQRVHRSWRDNVSSQSDPTRKTVETHRREKMSITVTRASLAVDPLLSNRSHGAQPFSHYHFSSREFSGYLWPLSCCLGRAPQQWDAVTLCIALPRVSCISVTTKIDINGLLGSPSASP